MCSKFSIPLHFVVLKERRYSETSWVLLRSASLFSNSRKPVIKVQQMTCLVAEFFLKILSFLF